MGPEHILCDTSFVSLVECYPMLITDATRRST
jgi:hypothetical protein